MNKIEENKEMLNVVTPYVHHVLLFLKKTCFLAANIYPGNIYLIKFNKRNTRKRYEIYLKITLKVPE